MVADSKMIAFTSDTSAEDLAKQHKKDGAAKDKKSESKPEEKPDDKSRRENLKLVLRQPSPPTPRTPTMKAMYA